MHFAVPQKGREVINEPDTKQGETTVASASKCQIFYYYSNSKPSKYKKNPPHVEITAIKALVESNQKTFEVVHQCASHAFEEKYEAQNNKKTQHFALS